MEVILIDDGSTDDSGRMCDMYAKQYKEIRVIHQANAGLSAARNAGIEVARGEFFPFVDSDDMVMPGFFQTAMRLLKKYQADFIAFSHERCEAEEKWGGKSSFSQR